MTLIELKNLIASKLGVSVSWIHLEKVTAGAVRFTYHGNTYRVTTDLNVEKVDGSDSDAQQLEKLLRGEQWDGTGLPPVGTECEYSLNDGCTWFRCKIEYVVGTQGVVMSCDVFEGIQYASFNDHDLKFRPLRTERDKAIEQIAIYVNNTAAENLYDAIVAGKIDGLGKVG